MSMYKPIPVTHTNLSSLQESKMSFILNKSPSLDVCPCLVSNLHDKLSVFAYDHVEDIEVNCSSKIVNVGDEAVFFTLFDKLVQESTIME